MSKSNSDRESLYFSTGSSSDIGSGVLILARSSAGFSLNENVFSSFLQLPPIIAHYLLAKSVNEEYLSGYFEPK